MSDTYEVVDLSMPLSPHWRWDVRLERTQEFGRGDAFQSSRVLMPCHAFTHVDAPVHFLAGGADVAAIDLGRTVGPAAIVDLRDVGADQPVTSQLLAERGNHVRPGDAVLLATCWDTKADMTTRDYWQRSPYMERAGAEWLLERSPRCVGFDFPQDHCIRRMGGVTEPVREEFVTHDVLLANDVILVEYLAGLAALQSDRVWFVAAPLRLEGADGSPVRALALRGAPWSS